MKIGVLLWFLFIVQAWATPLVEINSIADFDKFLVDSEYSGVGIVVKDNQVLWRNAFGKKDQEKESLLSVSDKFQIGSNTKQFVSAAILKLEQEKKLSLNNDLSFYFPQFEKLRGIKILDILNHTSGIMNYTDEKLFWDFASSKESLSLDDIINFSMDFPLDFTSKSNWNYSNTGYILAGKIIELVSGKSWDKYIVENFLVPLNMLNTGYVEHFNQVSDVVGHLEINDQVEAYRDYNLSWALSAGAFYSTIDDMVKWADIHLDSNLLNEESRSKMQSAFLNNYALGIRVSNYGSDILIGHGGRTPGFVSSTLLLKNQKLKIVTLDNEDGKIKGIDLALLRYFTEGKTTVIKNKLFPISFDKLNDYVGVYDYQGFQFTISVLNKKLILKTNDGQPAYTLKSIDLDTFNLMDFSAEEFVRNEDGLVVGLLHYQNGGKSYFNKIQQTNSIKIKSKVSKRLSEKFNFQRDFE